MTRGGLISETGREGGVGSPELGEYSVRVLGGEARYEGRFNDRRRSVIVVAREGNGGSTSRNESSDDVGRTWYSDKDGP